MNYIEKFKNPKWQKKRLKILQRDKFTCQSCKEKNKTLNVHHIYYDNEKEPWEYNNDDLITLCNECHKTWHNIFDNNDDIIARWVAKVYDEWEIKSIEKAMAKTRKKMGYE